MSMYFIGIDISKYKHDRCIISAADQKVVSKVTIKNNKAGFDELLTIINSLSNPEDIRIGFESTAHYALNLELFLESSLLNHSDFLLYNSGCNWFDDWFYSGSLLSINTVFCHFPNRSFAIRSLYPISRNPHFL